MKLANALSLRSELQTRIRQLESRLDQVLQEAQRAADGYLRKNTRWNRLWRRIPGPVYAAAGAVAATLCWCMALAL